MTVSTENQTTKSEVKPEKKPRSPRPDKSKTIWLWLVLAVALGALGLLAALNSGNIITTGVSTTAPVTTTTGTTTSAPANTIEVNEICADPRDYNVLYMATTAGLMRSADGGKTWQDTGLGNMPVLSISIDTDDNQRPLYAATAGKGLFKSTDGAKTWLNLGMANRVLVKVIARNNNLLVAANGPFNGIYLSSDGGKNWITPDSRSLPSNGVITNVSLDPANNQVLYMTTAYRESLRADDWARVKISRDGGVSWNALGEWPAEDEGIDPHTTLTVLLAAPGDRVYAGDGEKLYRLTPDRKKWIQVVNGLPDKGVYGLVSDPQRRGVLYAATRTGFYRNSDGTRWFKMSEGEQSALPAGLSARASASQPFSAVSGQSLSVGSNLRATLLFSINPDGRLVRYDNRDFGTGQFASVITDGTIQADFSLYGGVNPAARLDAPAATDPATLYFKETGHYLTGGFKNFWERNNGQIRYGLPITEEFSEFDQQQNIRRTVQYFEKVKLEYLPNQPPGQEIKVALLGREALTGKYIVPARFVNSTDQLRYFDATQHTLKGEFKRYWENNGGLAAFGYPVTEEIEEKDAAGKTLLVQYFERVKFQLSGNQVLLANLGVELLQSRGWLPRS
jgi:photosystem II stability/assembly factor-like uncharacterized protein